MLEQVSIIIPAAQHEPALDTLLDDLKIVIARRQSRRSNPESGSPRPLRGLAMTADTVPETGEIIISSEGTRAKSLNAGAVKAQHKFLWFLHADSRVTDENMKALEQSLQNKPDALHYFDLAFDEPGLPALNAWGANMRSRLFGTPFGDQGFCISKEQFKKIGGYPEDVSYGEDLMFVWKARQEGIKLNRVPSKLLTSARKYRIHGWLKLTLLYQWRWIGMSIPEMWKQR